VLLAAFDQAVVEALEQGQQTLQAAVEAACRQVEAMAAPVREQALGGAIEQILVEQDGDPDGDTKGAFGDQAGRRWRGDDAGVDPAGAGGAIAFTVDDTAMGVDLDLE